MHAAVKALSKAAWAAGKATPDTESSQGTRGDVAWQLCLAQGQNIMRGPPKSSPQSQTPAFEFPSISS